MTAIGTESSIQQGGFQIETSNKICGLAAEEGFVSTKLCEFFHFVDNTSARRPFITGPKFLSIAPSRNLNLGKKLCIGHADNLQQCFLALRRVAMDFYFRGQEFSAGKPLT